MMHGLRLFQLGTMHRPCSYGTECRGGFSKWNSCDFKRCRGGRALVGWRYSPSFFLTFFLQVLLFFFGPQGVHGAHGAWGMTERGWCNAQITPGREKADLVSIPVGDKDMGCVVRFFGRAEWMRVFFLAMAGWFSMRCRDVSFWEQGKSGCWLVEGEEWVKL